MGIPIHPPDIGDPGPDCPDCTPSPWPSGATPRIIRAVVHGLADYPGHPPQPNGIPVHLVNSDLVPCFWEATLYFGAGTYHYFYDATISLLEIDRLFLLDRVIFLGTLLKCKPGPFLNTALDPDFLPVGGTGNVLDLPLDYITTLADTYNLQPDPRALYDDIQSATPNHRCVRLTGRTYPGSVLIDLDLAGI
jgi:hypothetical protein